MRLLMVPCVAARFAPTEKPLRSEFFRFGVESGSLSLHNLQGKDSDSTSRTILNPRRLGEILQERLSSTQFNSPEGTTSLVFAHFRYDHMRAPFVTWHVRGSLLESG